MKNITIYTHLLELKSNTCWWSNVKGDIEKLKFEYSESVNWLNHFRKPLKLIYQDEQTHILWLRIMLLEMDTPQEWGHMCTRNIYKNIRYK